MRFIVVSNPVIIDAVDAETAVKERGGDDTDVYVVPVDQARRFRKVLRSTVSEITSPVPT